MSKLIICTALLLGALNVSGCTLAMSGGGYHYDHGDLVSSDGTVRYVGWCEVHTRNSHCAQSAATLEQPAVVAASTAIDPELR